MLGASDGGHRGSLVGSDGSHIYDTLLFQPSKHFIMNFNGDEFKPAATLNPVTSILETFTPLMCSAEASITV